MKLTFPANRSLGDPAKLRLFEVDYKKIKEIAQSTMRTESAVTRLALHIGLRLVAKELGIKLSADRKNGD